MIEKIQKDKENFRYKEYFYGSAREAMYDYVNHAVSLGYRHIILPAYIGWSVKEGSGIFDPIIKIDGLTRSYYKMDRSLQIDVADLSVQLKDKCIVLLVNYFGFRDRNMNEIIKQLREKDVLIVEDNAHGFFTYHINGQLDVDASFFSLHKLFPFEQGGSLIIQKNLNKFKNFSGSKEIKISPYEYDIQGIANKRKQNYRNLYAKIFESDIIKPLYKVEMIESNVPQTFPVLLLKGNRDKVYEKMNENNYGVVSLYHTMIPEITNKRFPDSLWISKRILNLPVHQDVDVKDYDNMLDCLINVCRETM